MTTETIIATCAPEGFAEAGISDTRLPAPGAQQSPSPAEPLPTEAAQSASLWPTCQRTEATTPMSEEPSSRHSTAVELTTEEVYSK